MRLNYTQNILYYILHYSADAPIVELPGTIIKHRLIIAAAKADNEKINELFERVFTEDLFIIKNGSTILYC